VVGEAGGVVALVLFARWGAVGVGSQEITFLEP